MRVKSVLDERLGRSDIKFLSMAQSFILDQKKKTFVGHLTKISSLFLGLVYCI